MSPAHRPPLETVRPDVGPVTARFARPRGVLALWAGVLAGPLAWAAHLQVAYLLVPHACERGVTWPLHLATAGALLVTLAGVAVAWGSWRRAGATLGPSRGGVVGRSRFMALGGLVLGIYFALVIGGEAIPTLLVSPCR